MAWSIRLSMVAVAFAVAAGCSDEPKSKEYLRKIYREEFGSYPSPAVQNLQARVWGMYDAYVTWLRFQASPEVVEELIASRFQRSDRQTFFEESVNVNSPRWWVPDADRLTDFYFSDPWKKEDLRSNAVIAFNDDRTVVYFCRSDSD